MKEDQKVIYINNIKYRYYDMEIADFVKQALNDNLLVRHEMEEPFVQHVLYQACDNLAFRFQKNIYAILKTDCLRLIEEGSHIVDFTFYSADEYIQILKERGITYPNDIVTHARLLKQLSRFVGLRDRE